MDARSIMPGLLCVALSALPLRAQDEWARPDSATVRLAPSSFPALPAPIRRDLERRGCRVPQAAERPEPHNVIRGAFTGPNRIEWAVLCSVRNASRTLLYGNSGTAPIDSFAESRDIDFLQGIGNGRIGFSHRIGVVTAAYIRESAKAYGGPKPPPVIDHDGIEDAFVGKASAIAYFYRGKWLSLQGAD